MNNLGRILVNKLKRLVYNPDSPDGLQSEQRRVTAYCFVIYIESYDRKLWETKTLYFKIYHKGLYT